MHLPYNNWHAAVHVAERQPRKRQAIVKANVSRDRAIVLCQEKIPHSIPSISWNGLEGFLSEGFLPVTAKLGGPMIRLCVRPFLMRIPLCAKYMDNGMDGAHLKCQSVSTLF